MEEEELQQKLLWWVATLGREHPRWEVPEHVLTAPCNDVDPRGLALGPAAFDASLSLQAGLQNKHYPFLIGSGPTSLQDAVRAFVDGVRKSVGYLSPKPTIQSNPI